MCCGKGCEKRGSDNNIEALEKVLSAKELEGFISIESGTCHHLHQFGPIVIIKPDNVLYTHVKIEDIQEIVDQHLIKDNIIERLLFKHPETGETVKDYERAQIISRELKQKR
jgi:(2Fe-2S) ferredoxin